MSYRRFVFFVLIPILLLLADNAHGQYGNIWAFGNFAGVDFNRNPPEPIQTSISTSEGSASICDAYGRLLFYTDGGSVWDRHDKLMPNGTDLPGLRVNITASTSQGTLIVPIPGSKEQYYVFSLGAFESGHMGKLYYSIIDMSLNNGLGDVVPESKGKLLSMQLTEHMTAVSGDNCNIWLLVASRSPLVLKAYSISFKGIDTIPVTSPRDRGGGIYGGIIGTMDVSPDRRKVALAHGNLMLYDFDPGTGKLSHPFGLKKDFSPYYYGVSFSPDNSKLYAGTGGSLDQFDLSANDTNVMRSSQTLLGSGWAIKRGPDGKVYSASGSNSLVVIQQPNLAGKACQYTNRGLDLATGSSSMLGLPNSATIIVNKQNCSSRTDTVFCADSFLLQARNLNGFNYKWEDGSLGTGHQITQSGTYWTSYQSAFSKCEEFTDTFHIIFYPIKRIYSTRQHTGMCKTDTFLMQASRLDADPYTWEDESGGAERKINRKGIYWVTYRIDSLCAQYADTFIVDYPTKEYEVSFLADTLACVGDPVSFNNTSDSPFNHFEWFFGDQDSATVKHPVHSYVYGGHYLVVLIGKIGLICADTVVRLIAIDSVFPLTFQTDKSRICNGESIAFYPHTDETALRLHWSFGDGGTFSGPNEQRVDHAYDLSGVLAVNLRADNRICPETSFTDTVYVYALPQIALGADTGLCLDGRAIVLQNLRSSPQGQYHHLWSTGDTSSTLRVVYPGLYSLTIRTEPLGCSTSESILIRKDCYLDIPNAFSPNGDGDNDYFLPRQLLSKKLSRFNMQIFNRWGQLVFETLSINGCGWDGRFNGKEQPGGVYVYKIDVEIDNRNEEHYQGNVTLLR